MKTTLGSTYELQSSSSSWVVLLLSLSLCCFVQNGEGGKSENVISFLRKLGWSSRKSYPKSKQDLVLVVPCGFHSLNQSITIITSLVLLVWPTKSAPYLIATVTYENQLKNGPRQGPSPCNTQSSPIKAQNKPNSRIGHLSDGLSCSLDPI